MKDQAIAQAQSQYEELITKEANDIITQSAWLRGNYVDFVKKRTEYKVQNILKQGENSALVSVVIISMTTPQRKTLADIASRVIADKERNFNFSNALQLIAKQTGSSATSDEMGITTVKMRKSGGSWVAEKPTP